MINFLVNLTISLLKTISVARAIFTSFGIAILVGSFGIYFSETSLSFVDSFYLSASAFCVTGLSPVPVSKLNLFTQVLIMIYIQIGGLGIILFTVIIGSLVVRGLSRNTEVQDFISQVLDTDVNDKKSSSERAKISRLILSILNITLTIEVIGAIILYNTFPEEIPGDVSRVFLSIFTSISAFNNAGFSILDDLSFTKTYLKSIYTISILIIMGGIGYPVIIFIEKFLLHLLHKIFSYLEILGETHLMRKAILGEEPSPIYFLFTKLSLWSDERIEAYNQSLSGESSKAQTNIILYGSLILLFLGTGFILLLEFNNIKTLGNLNLSEKVANALLISASARTAGFSTFNMADIQDPSVVLIITLMFIGGGPQGTAGGIKLTTFAILVVYLSNVVNSGSKISIFGYTISKRSVSMSIRLYFLATSTLATIIFLLSMLHENNNQLNQIAFEVVSAFSTVGFSLGFTDRVSDLEKIIYAMLMFVGRIGIFTVLIAVTGNSISSPIGNDDDGLKIQVG
ncbi:MAG: potassium transporter TrkG [Leptospiraceae bacterium]|nr:potassium transporter TrkG [Leptospiraceae bacterium]